MVNTILKNRYKKLLLVGSVALIILLIIIFPDVSSNGVSRGLVISANVIIPSLFPFMVCVLIFIKSGISIKNRIINKVIHIVFGHNFNMFFVFLLSMLGGYPIGAKLLNQLYIQKEINKKTLEIMLMYCVNAGPAFIISAVGMGVFNSRNVGYILFLSHTTSSIIISLLFAPKLKKISLKSLPIITEIKSFSEIFVSSVADAAQSVVQICSFVVLFSALNTYIEYFFKNIPIIYNASFLTEVTSAVTKTDNIYLVSFLLGFSGISIWYQIFAIISKSNVNLPMFILGRIMHGSLSVVFTYLILKVSEAKISVFSNDINYGSRCVYTNLSVSFSLFILLVLLIIFIYSKKYSGKFIDDVI